MFEKPQPSAKDTTPIKCEECENETFVQVFFIRKLSKLLTGESQDSIIPAPTFQCASCGHINKQFTLKI
jgi:ribosomal protein S27E